MRAAIAISWLVLLLSVGISGLGFYNRPVDATPAAITSDGLMRDLHCRTGETKKIVTRGVADNFSPSGNEPNFLRPGRRSVSNESFYRDGSYDQIQDDRRFTDSIPLPADVASGTFVIRLRAIGDNGNDSIGLGDLTGMGTPQTSYRASFLVPDLGKHGPWHRSGETYWVALDELQLHAVTRGEVGTGSESALDFVRSGGIDGWFDVSVLDDTAVDMMAAVLCIEPERGKGTSLAVFPNASYPSSNVVAISCIYGNRDQPGCNPYVGDTSCKQRLPMACIHSMGAPVPASIERRLAGDIWSGGAIAFTEPVPGDQFRTIHDADRFCAARFGSAWRTVTFHDGMVGLKGIAGWGSAANVSGRIWVDVTSQPHATCWSR